MSDQRTLRELVIPDVDYNALCIEYHVAAESLIENMSLNFQQVTTRDNFMVQAKGVNEIQVFSSNKALETRIDELTSLVKQLMLPIPPPPPYNPPQVTTFSPSEPSLEELVKQMVVNSLQFQQRTDYSIQILQTQIGQLATSMNVMEQTQGSNELPAQTVVNPKGPNVSAISLRSKKVTEPAPEKNKKIVSVSPENKLEPFIVVEVEKTDFPTLSSFDNIYSCDDCTNTNLCAICVEIDVALQSDMRQPRNYLILDIVKKEITFTRSFNTFTYQRFFIDPGIQGECTNQSFKVNGHYPKLLHENPTLEEETVEELSFGNAAYAITYPP
ncbi:hypothetical protein KIW84_032058 [Lathyrus oleraceus]|uniref:Uncharacterized protein n=1 Tax=Pisum sativum TaxID=3888 RepID=A0A9D4XS70_PEA|nr:hypothetical protein KIW84_032058 [Pisum sativum]